MTTQTQTLTHPQLRTLIKTSPNSGSKPVDHTSISNKRVPSTKPPFSVGDIRRAIPAHCFEHSYVKSFAYLMLDIGMGFTLFYGAQHIDTCITDKTFGGPLLGFLARHLLWTTYWIAQGIVFTGLWILAHECGHGAFSASETVNDVVGWVVHSFLMVPYFSWKISHRRHHSNTGNMQRDEVFVPEVAGVDEVDATVQDGASDSDDDVPTVTKANAEHDDDESYAADYLEQLQGTLTRCYWLFIMLTFGWIAYLTTNISSNKSYPPNTWVSHFHPTSPIYAMPQASAAQKSQQRQVIYSDIGLIITVAVMTYFATQYSAASVVYYYVIPLFQNIGWLTTITFLQHTDAVLPHYDSNEWDWLRGALATIDRDYGILNFFHHHIGDTHIVHHMFHTMPFYHAQEATDAVKPVLRDYYRMDRTPIAKALWKNYAECTTVYPDDKRQGVYWF